MSTIVSAGSRPLRRRFDELWRALGALELQVGELEAWGAALGEAFRSGGKLLCAGNGGSAALAAHLTAELVGRFDGERRALPAIWLGADQATLTALVNDYGADDVFGRQVEAFARPGDVVLLLSTSGRSPNLLGAAQRAAERGAECWAMTGPSPNPLAAVVDRVVSVPGRTAVVQEAHQVAVHLLCEQIEACLDAHVDPALDGAARPDPATDAARRRRRGVRATW